MTDLNELKSLLAELYEYFKETLDFKEDVKSVKLLPDKQNGELILGKTAHYNPNNCSITLFTLNRHPKDILRSYAHEMIHRIQDNEGRLKNITTTNTILNYYYYLTLNNTIFILLSIHTLNS